MALAGPALQALLPAVGRAGTMNAAANVAGQTTQLAGRLVPYLPAMGQFFSGDPLGAGLTATATKFAPTGTKTAVGLATSLLAPPVLGAAGGLATSLAGGVGNLAQAVTGQRREEGKSGLTGGGVGTEADQWLNQVAELSRITGRAQVDIAREMLPIQNQYLDNQMQRQMQLNQQTGQLTGALNRQAYTAQLAGGAQGQAGETVRTMMTAANPYAASAFQYRG
jgi:hypothetical protein